MAKQRVGSVSHLLGLISSLVTCMQVNLAMLTVLHCDLERQINFIISPYILNVAFLSGKARAKQTGQINPGNQFAATIARSMVYAKILLQRSHEY